MHTRPLHLLTCKCTMFPRSPCDSRDRICGLPTAGSLLLAFTLAQSLMWSDQTLMTCIPSSASGYIESQRIMGRRRVHIGMRVSVFLEMHDQKKHDRKKSAGDSLMIPAYGTSAPLSTSNSSDCKRTVKRNVWLLCLCAWIWNRSSYLISLAYDDWTQQVWFEAGKSTLLTTRNY